MVSPYRPTYVTGPTTGLVQNRQEMILPKDGYPILQNAFLFREQIRRKQGCQFVARFQRDFTTVSIGNSSASPWTFVIFSTVTPPITETNAEIKVGSVLIVVGTDTFTDQSNGTLRRQDGNLDSTINYVTSSVTLVTTNPAGTASTITFSYYPFLPAMGLLNQTSSSLNQQSTVGFDTTYAYQFVNGAWQEFIPGTTWTGTNSNFFWSTNYWVSNTNQRIFWVTNFSGTTGDPIRYTNGPGGSWIDFAPQIDASANLLTQSLALLPFRGRLLAFNTLEGAALGSSVSYPQRIRWSRIGTPFTQVSAIVTDVDANGWRDDIRGKGGYLDIPTSESIVSVGFVRDNLVIYCQRSTWQLRYTGRSIAPFQIEKVNTQLGAESAFSVISFDTSLVGIGDKGVVDCDSYKANRIDIKIPDLIFEFSNTNNGLQRIYGARDFIQRIAYWTYPYAPAQDDFSITFPNRRLIYNYENDSWAIYTDSCTVFGNYQPVTSAAWEDFTTPNDSWENTNNPWIAKQGLNLNIMGGNQQGFTFIMDSQVSNDITLSIRGITGNTTTPTSIESPNHNLEEGTIIEISNIPTGTPFSSSLNGNVFYVEIVDTNNFLLWVYDPLTDDFNTPQLNDPASYVGGGNISIRDNFRVVSKKFNFLDQGKSIQLGYVDVLMNATSDGAIQMKVYANYNNSTPVNLLPENINPSTQLPDTFFNSIVPTTNTNDQNSSISSIPGTKYWQRIFCPSRANFITIEWTLSNAQMVGVEQQSDVQIDAQILWFREAGRLTNF